MTLINKYDWFTPIKPVMERNVPRNATGILEVGSFEGLSARFFCEHCKDAHLTCIDHFKGGDDQSGLDIDNLKHRFDHNTSDFKHRITCHVGNSWDALCYCASESQDVVFVDGSHLCWDVLNDLCQSYRICRKGGLIIADDYSWQNERPDCPKVAIDSFLHVFKSRVALVEIERVAVIRKIC